MSLNVRERIDNLRNYGRLFSDFRSMQAWRAARHAGANSPIKLRLRALRGRPITCRPNTSDPQVLWDAFVFGYHLPPRDMTPRTILDLGSNIGLTMAHYATLFPDARILGIELDHANYDLCVANTAGFGDRCNVLWGAAWIKDGQVSYSGCETWGFHVEKTGTRIVRSYSIESLVSRLGASVDFVKMDIEGAEADLLGGPAPWAARVCCINVEVHEPYTVARCGADLARLNFIWQPHPTRPNAVIAWSGRA